MVGDEILPNGPYVYWSSKDTDGTFREQGDPGVAGHLFAWRTPDTPAYDETYWGWWPTHYPPPPPNYPGL